MLETKELSSMSGEDLFDAVKSEDKDDETSSKLLEELERRANSADEIMETYEGSVGGNGQRARVSRSVMRKGIREAGLKGGNFGFANEIEGTWLDLENLPEDQKNSEKPQVWIKPVEETKYTFFGKKKKVKTDEVLVITRMNNSDKEGEGTIAFGVVRQKDGVPQLEEGNGGWFAMLSESDYQEVVTSSREELGQEYPDDPTKRMLKEFLRGETTIKNHEKRFKWWMGKKSRKYWKERDKKVVGTPQRWRTKENIRQGFFENLEINYKELMQETMRQNGKVHDEVEEKLEVRRVELGIETVTTTLDYYPEYYYEDAGGDEGDEEIVSLGKKKEEEEEEQAVRDPEREEERQIGEGLLKLYRKTVAEDGNISTIKVLETIMFEHARIPQERIVEIYREAKEEGLG